MTVHKISALALALGAVTLACGCGTKTVSSANNTPGAAASALTLLQARKAHQTQLLKSAQAPQNFNPHLVGPGSQVRYKSAGRTLIAWFITPPGRGPFPAILYCHHGYALDTSDIEAVRPFVEAGYAVLLPSYRGENGNPGSFEMFYGEVDDALAALDALASVPSVDHNRIMAVGFGAGGTIAMLMAESGAPVREVVGCDATVDYAGNIKNDPPWPEAPFDWHDPVEDDLRVAARHLQDLDCPVHLYYAEDQRDLYNLAQPLPREADAFKKTVTVTTIPGSNEADILGPLSHAVLKDFTPIYVPPNPVQPDDPRMDS